MLKEISIDNFKSLKSVRISLGPICFFCGPNASGKTNLAEAFDFLSHVFRDGLQYAVAEKGGYYNICFRRKRRTKGSIGFRVVAETKLDENTKYLIEVGFSIRAKSQAIRAQFVVDSEEYKFGIMVGDPAQELAFLRITRSEKAYQAESSELNDDQFRQFFGFRNLSAVKQVLADFSKPSPQQLLLSPTPEIPFGWFGRLKRSLRELAGLHVFQINPRTARQAGTPSVLKGLGRHGENLPVAVDTFLSKKNLSGRLLSWLKDVIPELSALEPGYTETKQIGLFLHEHGIGAPWYAEDLSDGTLMSLALFICLLEPTHRTVLIEEPENSLHPWILKRFMDRCREVSTMRQILITTHSPLVVAASEPGELYLIERRSGMTEVFPATDREPLLSTIVRKNVLDLGEYWLSGGLGAVPTPSEEDTFTDDEEEN
jgi:predicted ATPase